jgi:hypothetical protein
MKHTTTAHVKSSVKPQRSKEGTDMLTPAVQSRLQSSKPGTSSSMQHKVCGTDVASTDTTANRLP